MHGRPGSSLPEKGDPSTLIIKEAVYFSRNFDCRHAFHVEQCTGRVKIGYRCSFLYIEGSTYRGGVLNAVVGHGRPHPSTKHHHFGPNFSGGDTLNRVLTSLHYI
jgi:hypothetical protein